MKPCAICGTPLTTLESREGGGKCPSCKTITLEQKEGETLDAVMDRIGDGLGWFDHNMRRDRPYNGQPHTDTGERGKQEIKGITMRDLRDCFIRAVLLSTGGSNYQLKSGNPIEDRKVAERTELLYHEAEKGENAAICENDLYGFNLDRLDPMAISQNLTCEVERVMGIFPNLPDRKETESEPNTDA